MQEMQKEKQSQQFDGILIAGLILGIVISSIITIVFSILIIWFLWAGSLVASVGLGALIGGSVFVVVIFCLILMIGPIINLILTVRFLKGKSDNKTAVGVLNIFFGGIISGIFILVGTEKQNYEQDSTPTIGQNDPQYQEYLRNKEQNKVHK